MTTRKIAAVIAGRSLVTASIDDSVEKAAKTMAEANVGAVLIVTNGRLEGVFTERDLLKRVVAVGKDPQTTLLTEVGTFDPVTISPERQLGHAMHLMMIGGFRHVPVVDNGEVVGVVSARDMLGAELIEFEHEVERLEEIAEILA